MNRWWRGVLGGAAVVAGAAGLAAATLGLGGRPGAGPAPPAPAGTATVTRQTLTRTVTLPGELGHGAAVPLTSAAPGVVTWLPKAGAVVRRGGTLLRADERPVLLLYGEVPMYRSLAVGAEGRDVRQLERNLSALGYRGFTVDETFSAATATAVKAWQRDLELPETGVVDRPWVVYAPGAVRVADRLVRLGAPAAADVLSYTSTVRAVTVRADAGDVTWAAPGARVTVELPDGARTAGRVTGVSDQVGAGDGAGSGDGGGDTGGGERAATVAVGVAVPDQKALGRTARAPVRVRYVAQERKNVLAVPVGALLALAEGGYGLELVTGATRRLVAVAVGLFADGLVEVSGAGVAEGSTVGTAG